MQVTKQLTVAIDFHSILICSNPWKAMAVNCLITNIFQNIFCSTEERSSVLEQLDGEKMITVFGWSILLNFQILMYNVFLCFF